MAAFKTVAIDSAYLSLEYVQELVLAYSERRQCVGDSAVSAIAAGENIQDVTFWRAMQDWIETSIGDGEWVDDSNFSTSTTYSAVTDRVQEGNIVGDLHLRKDRRRRHYWPLDCGRVASGF